MKQILVFVFYILITTTATAQIIDPKIAAKRAAERRANQRIDQGVDKGLDKAEEAIGGIFKKKGKKSSNETTDDEESGATPPSKTASSKKSNSSKTISGKYDFVPGEKVIAIEDFSQDALGDFPAKWNTDGSGELVKINDANAKYLKFGKESIIYPEFVNGLPENFTMEFDLASTDAFSYYNSHFIFGFTDVVNVGKNWRTFKRFGNRKETKSTVEIGLHPTGAGGNMGMSYIRSYNGGDEALKNEQDQAAFQTRNGSTMVHVAIWRQKGRLRVYVDQEKIWDIPRAFAEGIKINSVYFRCEDVGKDDDAYYMANLRIAVGAPDTRNKLITEGKFVTNGILFDVNSDKIKPESYGVLKDIANVLQENPDVNIKIVGHTDADGDEAANLALSKKRAESVKKALSSQFDINNSRMTTDGKGESQPTNNNNTPEGKANNRRVEFIKT